MKMRWLSALSPSACARSSAGAPTPCERAARARGSARLVRPRRRPRAARRPGGEPFAGRGAAARPRRGVRLRQDHDGARSARPAGVERNGLRPHAPERHRHPGRRRGDDPPPPLDRPRDRLPGRDERAQPRADGRCADRRGARGPRPRVRPHGAGPRGGAARVGRHPARPWRALPARVLRRDAAAGGDRDRARMRSERAGRGRADDGARRDGAGADPRAARPSAATSASRCCSSPTTCRWSLSSATGRRSCTRARSWNAGRSTRSSTSRATRTRGCSSRRRRTCTGTARRSRSRGRRRASTGPCRAARSNRAATAPSRGVSRGRRPCVRSAVSGPPPAT